MSQHLARSAVRVVLIEDHALFAESLELALSLEGYDVRRAPMAEIGVSAAATLASVVRMRPQIVLLDLDLGPCGDGLRMVAPLVAAGVHVVVVTASADRPRWGDCVRQGARKVLPKTRPLNEILATVRRINQGLPVMNHTEREELVQLAHDHRHELRDMQERLRLLTPREGAVLGHLMKGRTVREIAIHGYVSEATVAPR